MKPTVYIETTIISYLTARQTNDPIRQAHQLLTQQWWTDARSHFDLFTSDLVIVEASAGDPDAAQRRLTALSSLPLLAFDDTLYSIADRIAQFVVLPEHARADALHVAYAAFHSIDYLLTWNCKHLANGMLLKKIEHVCADLGYNAPVIVTPELLMEFL